MAGESIHAAAEIAFAAIGIDFHRAAVFIGGGAGFQGQAESTLGGRN
jgi:hypothetical protein